MEETKKELLLTREFDAPRELVYKAWTDPELVAQWWGPDIFTSTVETWETHPQGALKIVMHGQKETPFAGDFPMTGEFRSLKEPEEIIYTSNAIINEQVVLETMNTVTFEEVDGKTKMTVHIQVTMTTPEAAGPLYGMEMGWNQQLDKLVRFITKQK